MNPLPETASYPDGRRLINYLRQSLSPDAFREVTADAYWEAAGDKVNIRFDRMIRVAGELHRVEHTITLPITDWLAIPDTITTPTEKGTTMNDHQILTAYGHARASVAAQLGEAGAHLVGLRAVRDAALTEPGVFSEADSINDIVNQIIAMYPEQTGDLLAEYRAAKKWVSEDYEGSTRGSDIVKREALRALWSAAYLAGKADAGKNEIAPEPPAVEPVPPLLWEERDEEHRTQALVTMTFADIIELRAQLEERYETQHAAAAATWAALEHIGDTIRTMTTEQLGARIRTDHLFNPAPAGPPAA